MEGQDSIFGSENSVTTGQSSNQPLLPEPENKMDESIDNQQQVGTSNNMLRLMGFCTRFI